MESISRRNIAVEDRHMVTFYEALEIILGNTERMRPISVPLLESYNFTLAQDIQSTIDIPPFRKSAMDGYAVRSENIGSSSVVLKVIDEIQAGMVSTHEINRGECAKIMTGAPVPLSADSVIRFEDTETLPGGYVRIQRAVEPYKNIIPKGEDARKGEVIIPKDTTLKGPEIAALASIGEGGVRVYGKPKIGIISTGNELRESFEHLDEGTIRNSNGPMQQCLGNTMVSDVTYIGIVRDELMDLMRFISQSADHDVLILSGGVSVGTYDLVTEALEKCGAQILVNKVMIKPGKPFVFGKMKRCLVFGLSGNPVSNFIAFYLYVTPVLQKMMGRPDYSLRLVEAQIETDFYKKTNYLQIVPSRYSLQERIFRVSPLSIHGSADIIGCSGCNCLTFIEEEKHHLRRGDSIQILLFEY
jgi:molybdopterin molybdotransferase